MDMQIFVALGVLLLAGLLTAVIRIPLIGSGFDRDKDHPRTKMKNVTIYHHVDNDGYCAAAVARKYFLSKGYSKGRMNFVPVNYGSRVNFESLLSTDFAVVVDFAFPADDMENLYLRFENNFVWIDHHHTSISELPGTYNGLRRNGSAGCELAWEFFFPKEKIPLAVNMIGRYDIWDHHNPSIVPFQYGVAATTGNSDPASDLWTTLFQGRKIRQLVNEGKAIIRHEEEQTAIYAKSYAFDGYFEGLPAIFLNIGMAGQIDFQTVFDPQKHKIMVGFGCKRGKEWKIALRAQDPNIDCGALAQKYHGGGHRGAAGFIVQDITIILPELSTPVAKTA